MKILIISMIICCGMLSVKAQNISSITNNGKVWASIYQQRAAEYKALCFQAYNVAKMRLDIALKRRHKKPYAVITDIDETLLDNSPYDAGRAINNLDYDLSTWKIWTAKGICDTVPGAPSFLKYAAAKGVAVYYITNRDEDERAGTMKNLNMYHLPYITNQHILLKQGKSSKEDRRLSILKTHQVILYCGDNLPDFNTIYDDHPSETNRKTATEKLKKSFGNNYIVLPNPSYDDWESAIFEYRHLTNTQKDSIIKAKIKTAN